MMKHLILVFIIILTGCHLFNSSNQMTCQDKQQVCEYNQTILKEAIDKFKAKGGAYYVMDMGSQEVVSGAVLNIDIHKPYHPSNIMKLFTYASGLKFKQITLKEVEFNTSHVKALEKISKENLSEYYARLDLEEQTTPIQLLKSYTIFINSNDSKDLKPLLRNNVQNGAAKRTDIKEIDVYGLTSTEYKPDGKEVITTFIGHFSKHDKKYALITILDEPQALKSTWGFKTSGWNAVELAKNIILNIDSTH